MAPSSLDIARQGALRLTWRLPLRLLLVHSLQLAAASTPKQPLRAGLAKPRGIVVFLLDDHGYGDFGVEETPSLNRLAAEGVRFTDFHAAAAVCTPSRAGLLTGRLAPRTGMGANFGEVSSYGLNQSEVTMADVLAKQGYTSHIIGKWHLGHNPPFHPTYRGFSTYLGLPYSGDMGCIDASPQGCNPAWNRSEWQPACPALCGETSATAIPLYDSRAPSCSGRASCNEDITQQPFDPLALNRRYAERAVEIIEEHAKSEKPFFLYMAFAHTHTPLAYDPLHFANASRRPGRAQVFGNTLAEVDWAVGQVMGALERHQLEEETLVVATADNGPSDLGQVACEAVGSGGPFDGTWQKSPKGGGGGSTCKMTQWECGHRVMGIFRWKGAIGPAGRTAQELASALDLMPTLASITGAKLPTDRRYDGIDLSPILFPDAHLDASAFESRVLFHAHNEREVPAMRMGKYKAWFRTFGSDPCRRDDGTHAPSGASISHRIPLVFDLEADPAESTPIELDNEVLSAMVQALDDFWHDVNNTFRTTVNFAGKMADRPCSNSSSPCCRLEEGSHSRADRTEETLFNV